MALWAQFTTWERAANGLGKCVIGRAVVSADAGRAANFYATHEPVQRRHPIRQGRRARRTRQCNINRSKDSDFHLPVSRERQRVDGHTPLAGARGY